MELKDLEEMFKMEQELDIPHRDRWYNKDFDKRELEAVDNALYTLLTAGLCDNCKVPKMINTGGDGVHEPAYEELYCEKKKIFIAPQPPEDQVKECDGFEPCS